MGDEVSGKRPMLLYGNNDLSKFNVFPSTCLVSLCCSLPYYARPSEGDGLSFERIETEWFFFIVFYFY